MQTHPAVRVGFELASDRLDSDRDGSLPDGTLAGPRHLEGPGGLAGHCRVNHTNMDAPACETYFKAPSLSPAPRPGRQGTPASRAAAGVHCHGRPGSVSASDLCQVTVARRRKTGL